MGFKKNNKNQLGITSPILLILILLSSFITLIAVGLILRQRIIFFQKAQGECDSNACEEQGVTNNLVCSEGGFSGNGDGKTVARNCNDVLPTNMECVAHVKVFSTKEECNSFNLDASRIDSSSPGIDPIYKVDDKACYGLTMICEHPMINSAGCYATQSDITDGSGHQCHDKKKDCSLCPEPAAPTTPPPTDCSLPQPTGLISNCDCANTSSGNCKCNLSWNKVSEVETNGDYRVTIWDVTDGTYNGRHWGHLTSGLNNWTFEEAEPGHKYEFSVLPKKNVACVENPLYESEKKDFSCSLCPVVPIGTYCICAQAKVYDENWNYLEDLKKIEAGKTYHFTVFGRASSGDLYPGRARFRINGAADNSWCLGTPRTVVNNWCEVNGEGRHVGHTGNPEYFVDFKIPETGGTFTIQTEVYCPSGGWK
ncbi:MAG: hypothetical protein BWY24_00578 [Microgenomates group bacterium ADurb.Bin219]|nr:MAG: hypothetical protein BWY24_00578 [Microgenomates group bacterium ADurb.Bin219]HNP89314.1 hypothetical protein [Candidatus Woesebacteria bacterium]